MLGLRINRFVLNYSEMKYIFGHISIYKRGDAEIFKNIGYENDNLLININIYVN